MKRILPRFFRCFLIAALAAAIAVPLAPAVADTAAAAKLTVSPSSAVPGQAVTVSGTGFTANTRVNLWLAGGGAAAVMAGAGAANDTPAIPVKPDGTFVYMGTVPFDNEVTAMPGRKTWTAAETTEDGRAASSSAFTVRERQVLLSPGTAWPGRTVEVFGSGWGVKTRGSVNSQVTLTLSTNPNATYGPFPVQSNGEFAGAIVVPARMDMQRLTVIATDNNGPTAAGGTGGFSANQTAEAVLRVPTGVVTLTPSAAVVGKVITVSGTGFPALTPLSELRFPEVDKLPTPPPATDASGSFTVTVTVPVCYECLRGPRVVSVTVGDVLGTALLTIPGPSIGLSTGTARAGDTITISGRAFSAFANVDTINFGAVPALPVPNPRADGVGDFSAEVVVPTLHPGAYTVTVRTGANFTATASIRILSATVGSTVPAETAFQALTSRGLLTLAAAAAPGGTKFGAYVPGLPGDTLLYIPPNGVLILTLNEAAKISVGGQPAVDVKADTPTFFSLGPVVSVDVIEHDP